MRTRITLTALLTVLSLAGTARGQEMQLIDNFDDCDLQANPVWEQLHGDPFGCEGGSLSYTGGPYAGAGVIQIPQTSAYGSWKWWTKVEGNGHYSHRDVFFVWNPGSGLWDGTGYYIRHGEPCGDGDCSRTWFFGRRDGTDWIELASVQFEQGFDLGVWRECRVERDIDGTFRVFVDGNLAMTAIDNQYTSSTVLRIDLQDHIGGYQTKYIDSLCGPEGTLGPCEDYPDPFDIVASVTDLYGDGGALPIVLFGQEANLGEEVGARLWESDNLAPFLDPLPQYSQCIGYRNSDKSTISRISTHTPDGVLLFIHVQGNTGYMPGSSGYFEIRDPMWRIEEVVAYQEVNVDYGYGTRQIDDTRLEWDFRGGCADCACRENELNWVVRLSPRATSLVTDEPTARPSFANHTRTIPNPSGGSSKILLRANRPEVAQIAIHDVSGRLIRSLGSQAIPQGESAVTWDGRDENGRTVAPGTYFYIVRTDSRQSHGKITRTR